MFIQKDDTDYTSPVEGIKMKTLVWGKKTLLTRFELKKGSSLPDHSHPHEQTGYMVSGKMKLIIDGKEVLAQEGDSWSIPGDIKHRAEVLEDSVAIEVFSPVREDYLPEKS